MPVIRPNSALQGDKNVMSGLYPVRNRGDVKYVNFGLFASKCLQNRENWGRRKDDLGDRESFH